MTLSGDYSLLTLLNDQMSRRSILCLTELSNANRIMMLKMVSSVVYVVITARILWFAVFFRTINNGICCRLISSFFLLFVNFFRVERLAEISTWRSFFLIRLSKTQVATTAIWRAAGRSCGSRQESNRSVSFVVAPWRVLGCSLKVLRNTVYRKKKKKQ